jgi:prophage antirepressor-like protein
MVNVIPFKFEAHALRVVLDADGQPWFNANDVCAALELTNPHKAVADHVDPEDVTKRDTLTAGGRQQTNHVNDSGLYALIMGSNKDAGRRFRRWVLREVLPAALTCTNHIGGLTVGSRSRTQRAPHQGDALAFHEGIPDHGDADDPTTNVRRIK